MATQHLCSWQSTIMIINGKKLLAVVSLTYADSGKAHLGEGLLGLGSDWSQNMVGMTLGSKHHFSSDALVSNWLI